MKNKPTHIYLKSFLWFLVGAFLGLFLFISFIFIFFQKKYHFQVYPGVMINGTDFGGRTQQEVASFFSQKNDKIGDTKFAFMETQNITIISARQIKFGYDENLMATQAYLVGRSNDLLSNISLVIQAYINGINLSPSYKYSEAELEKLLSGMIETISIPPTEALFTFQNGKVVAFRPSLDGQEVDIKTIKNILQAKTITVVTSQRPQTINIPVPIKVVKPKVTTDKINNLGIRELIGTGSSLFQGSIQNRIYNITLAATRLNGILVAPDEVFSFNKALGDVSAFTGYKQAYIIQNGRTVLGDGGGVCQVSTTLFRAILNAGLPIVERNAHAYRVGYYEQDSSPGIDATIYVPSVDLKFKNDTGNYILIESFIDPTYERLTFLLYGTKDNREISISKPIITSQAPPPSPLYQDDPTLLKGTLRQIDFPAWGASVFFTREVKKDGKVIISEKFISNYQPWQAVYLRGTKE